MEVTGATYPRTARRQPPARSFGPTPVAARGGAGRQDTGTGTPVSDCSGTSGAVRRLRSPIGTTAAAVAAMTTSTAQVGTWPHSPSSSRKPGIVQVVKDRISVSKPGKGAYRDTT